MAGSACDEHTDAIYSVRKTGFTSPFRKFKQDTSDGFERHSHISSENGKKSVLMPKDTAVYI